MQSRNLSSIYGRLGGGISDLDSSNYSVEDACYIATQKSLIKCVGVKQPTNFVFAMSSRTYSEHDMIICRLVPAITWLKNADKELQKLVPLEKISDAYAFTWANLVLNVIF